ncbi:FIST signal transduction protein [Flavobacterium silvaticum]|uniref:FIST C-domain domain-containing protein n=1 Tax=Flavobacterium silvaticum TaxID=1852020 RepID=A0A972FS88_9FLAO|nr:FIST N-terminal domain-containing protein [Flavobacterium silvaticum]NMH26585.1 hypothetical protein [Flavobacterium silvaticum]
MVAKSIHGNSITSIKTSLEKLRADGFLPTLAITFQSIKQDREALRNLFTAENIDLIGATSSGEFIDGHQSEGEIAILLLDLSRDLYSIVFEQIKGSTIMEAADKISKAALQKFANPSLIVCSTGTDANGEFLDAETLVRAIETGIGAHRYFYGGMAGDDMTFTGSYVFTNERQTDCGILALVLDADKIQTTGQAITGWQKMGLSRKVTKSSGNLIYEIDGLNAVEMYLKYLGKSASVGDREFKVFEELGFTYPFIVERDSNETLLKTPLEIDHVENALRMDVEMAEGDRFWFTMPPDFEIVEEIIHEASQLKKDQGDADALIVFSCAGRPPVLGPLVTSENDGLAEVWNSPMAGFFTYGEYGRAKNGKQHFHSGACCWVALTEK